MLITFKSKESADIIMFGDIAKQLLTIMGKDGHEQEGIVTVEQLPSAIANLKEAIGIDRDRQQQLPEQAERAASEDDKSGIDAPVGLSQRAWPLVDMLERAKEAGTPVIWKT